jgi:hypothetical protein
MYRSAIISPCKTYRYRLERTIGAGPTMMFLMVNPSTADADQDDPTVRKCIGFAQRNGYGRILIGNKFAYRAKDINALEGVNDPIGPDNDIYLRPMIAESDVVVAAWGTLNKIPEALRARWHDIVRMADAAEKPLYCLGANADKHPRHPLMLSYGVPVSPWRTPWFLGRKKRAPEITQQTDAATAAVMATPR